MSKRYYICKKGNISELIYIDYDKLTGYDFVPKNGVKYEGISINKMVIIKPSMIAKILRKKIKRKLELYLKLIIRILEEDDPSGESLREALNDLTRYKNIIDHKYKKYLEDKYLDILYKKIAILEYEIKVKQLNSKKKDDAFEIRENHRRR